MLKDASFEESCYVWIFTERFLESHYFLSHLLFYLCVHSFKDMGLGIIEPKRRVAHVPATVLLLQADLKGVAGKDKEAIVLVPRPSDSPRDPLVGALSPLHEYSSCITDSPIELAIVEERSMSFCHLPFNYRRWYSSRHTADSQWGPATGVPHFDHKS